MKSPLQKVIAVVGPTASGKTELGIRIAERFGGEIVNADSMQVYRGMDIGTAKPSPAERIRIPHHLLDVADPDEEFSAGRFVALADEAIRDITSRGKLPVIVGGTGLYVRALLEGIASFPEVDRNVREELEAEVREGGLHRLYQRLREVDPVTAEKLHPHDRVRIVRALEIAAATGERASDIRAAHGFSDRRYDSLRIGIRVERGELAERISERVDGMLGRGFVDEVRGLLERGYPADLKSMRSIGYKEVASYLAGGISLPDAAELMKRETRRYAKRQQTWFNKEHSILWFEYPGNFDMILSRVMRFLD